MWFSAQVAVIVLSLAATHAADDCSLSPSMNGIPAQRLAYALQNVTCPVNLGYTALYYSTDSSNTSSVLPASRDIVTTLKDTTAYLNATGAITSAAQIELWRGPIADVPYEFSQWIGQLLDHKKYLAKSAADLAKGLEQQRDAARVFFDLVAAKVDDKRQKDDVKGQLSPVLDQLDCAAGAFKQGSTVTTCAATFTGTATASGGGSASKTSMAATASSTDDDSGGAGIGHSMGRVLTGALVVCGGMLVM